MVKSNFQSGIHFASRKGVCQEHVKNIVLSVKINHMISFTKLCKVLFYIRHYILQSVNHIEWIVIMFFFWLGEKWKF